MKNPLLDLKSRPYESKANKLHFPKTILKYTDDDVKLFNEIIDFCRLEDFLYVDLCPAGSLSHAGNLDYVSRYSVLYSDKKRSVELVIASKDFGCYRIIVGVPKKDDETSKGTKAIKKFYNICKELNIDLTPYALTKEQGLEVKKTIKKPHIECYDSGLHYNCYHLDFNSSHPAGIAERNPELRLPIELLYAQRKVDSTCKDLMNFSQGIMQSEFCIDFKTGGRAPYQFAGLSRDANNRTREMVELYIEKLKAAGKTILLTNTDGIWYTTENENDTPGPYHDELEGTKLGQWKTDYSNVTLCIKSAGCYQIKETNGTITNKCRGQYTLDLIKPRDQWKFGEILLTKEILYRFDKETKHIIKEN